MPYPKEAILLINAIIGTQERLAVIERHVADLRQQLVDLRQQLDKTLLDAEAVYGIPTSVKEQQEDEA